MAYRSVGAVHGHQATARGLAEQAFNNVAAVRACVLCRHAGQACVITSGRAFGVREATLASVAVCVCV